MEATKTKWLAAPVTRQAAENSIEQTMKMIFTGRPRAAAAATIAWSFECEIRRRSIVT